MDARRKEKKRRKRISILELSLMEMKEVTKIRKK
jgi:hypothetical protein